MRRKGHDGSKPVAGDGINILIFFQILNRVVCDLLVLMLVHRN